MSDEAAVTHDDLRSLCSSDPEERVNVRCRQCDMPVVFTRNTLDPPKSYFTCTASWGLCGATWTWHRLFVEDPKAIGHWFFVIPPKVEGELWDLVLINDLAQKKAYTRLLPRNASVLPERMRRLEVLRAAARRMR